MAPPPIQIQSLGLLEPAGASSDRIASPWRGRDRSASPHPDPVSSTGVVPQPTTPMSGGPLSPSASPGRRHYPNARAEKNSNPIAAPEKRTERTACPVTPVVPPWMQPDKGVKSSLKTSRRVQDMAGTLNIGNMGVNSLSTTDKTTAQRALSIFNIPSMEITSRKGRLGLHSRSLPPEVFGAAPSQPVESPKRRPRVIVESPEIPCCAMTIQPVVVRPLEKTTRGRLTGPDLRALAEMEEVVEVVSQQPVPRRSVKEIISVSFKPLMRGGHGGKESQTSVAQSTTATGNTQSTQSPVSLNTQSPVSLTSEVSAT